MKRLSSLGLVLLWIAAAPAQPTRDATEGLETLRVPIDKPSPIRDAALGTLSATLAETHPAPKVAPKAEVAKSGAYVLWGDLFGTGDCFAVFEIRPPSEDSADFGIAFSEWKDGQWQLRQLWNIPVIWRPQGWKASDGDYLPATPASEPFALRDFGGGGTPELVVAGEVHKYFQENYLFRFLKRSKTLALVAGAMAPPMKVEDYVVLYFNSGRRSIWAEWQFCKWSSDELVPVASWHDETGYNPTDPTFAEGQRFQTDGKAEVIRITYGHGAEYDDQIYELTRNGKPFGRMRIPWNEEKVRLSLNSDEIEKAWLFEKTTGLPRRLYPNRESSNPIPKLEDYATVTIEGDAEAATLFATKH